MNLLILGGSTEASALARAVAALPWTATLSYAGRTRDPATQPIPVRSGGFGGAGGLADYLRQHAIDAFVDATHPFAAQITRNAHHAAAATGTPLLAIVRPAWTRPPGARWHEVASTEEAAAALGSTPRRVLLTVGGTDLLPFAAAAHHRYVVRAIDPPASAPAGSLVIEARGPFDEAAERDLLRTHHIDALVSKNSGGAAAAAKLRAAAALGVETVMVRRPPVPDALPIVPTVDAALRWLEAQAGTRRGR